MKDLKDIKLKICKYKIKKLTLTIPSFGEYTVEPMYVSEFFMEKDFDKYDFPYLKLRIVIPNRVYRAMKKENNKIDACLIVKYALFEHTEIASEKTNVKESNFISDNFYVYMEESSPSMLEDFEKKVDPVKNTKDKKSIDFNNASNVEIMLVKKQHLQIVNTKPNMVIYKSNLMDILTYLLQSVGMNRVLCSPPNNNKIYDQFLINPIRLNEQIYRLCNDYAFHDDGTLFFMDFDTNYILSKNEKCTAWKPNEYKYTKILYNPPLKNGNIAQGVYIDATERTNYCTMREATIASSSMTMDQVYGSGYTVVDKKSGDVTTVKAKTKTVPTGGTISRTIVSDTGEAASVNALKKRVEEQTMVWTVVIDNVLLTMLTPNKEFELIFLTSSLSRFTGKYRLKKYITMFNKSDGEWFTPTTAATFFGKK